MMKVGDWTPALAADIERLRLRWLESAKRDHLAIVAEKAKALPVYVDMGGALLISEEGNVLQYDDERGELGPLDDRLWFRVALVTAARRFPELRVLFPEKPADAPECGMCGGSGLISGLQCGKCAGTGWLET